MCTCVCGLHVYRRNDSVARFAGNHLRSLVGREENAHSEPASRQVKRPHFLFHGSNCSIALKESRKYTMSDEMYCSKNLNKKVQVLCCNL